jgi:hypothetical protein
MNKLPVIWKVLIFRITPVNFGWIMRNTRTIGDYSHLGAHTFEAIPNLFGHSY